MGWPESVAVDVGRDTVVDVDSCLLAFADCDVVLDGAAGHKVILEVVAEAEAPLIIAENKLVVV